MSASVLYMAMSLDGYIAGPNDEPDNPGGDGFMRLHEWFVTPGRGVLRPSGPAGELYDEMMDATGAVLAGRRTVEQVDHWGGDHHGRPDLRAQPPAARSVGRELPAGDVRDSTGSRARWRRRRRPPGTGTCWCMARTRRNGRSRPGCWTSCRSSQIPVLFGGGRRLFDVLPSRVELEIVRVIDTPEATHIRYRVRR